MAFDEVRNFHDYCAADRDVINRFNVLHDLVYLHPSLEFVKHPGEMHLGSLRVKAGEKIETGELLLVEAGMEASMEAGMEAHFQNNLKNAI